MRATGPAVYPAVRSLPDRHRGQAPFDGVMQQSPALYLKAGQLVRVNGGAQAGFLDNPSLWQDRSGNGRHATQDTALNQPTNLPLDGKQYALFTPINGNYFSTDTAVSGLSGTDPQTLRVVVDGISITGITQYALAMRDETNSWLSLYISNVGGSAIFYGNIQSLGLNFDVADGGYHDLLFAWDGTGNLDVYDNGQLKQQVSGLSTANWSSSLTPHIGGRQGNTSFPLDGRVYKAAYYSGVYTPATIESAGIGLFDWDPARDAVDNGTSGVCGSGQPWTLNQSGNNPCEVVGSPFMRGNGVNSFMDLPIAPFSTILTQAGQFTFACRVRFTGTSTNNGIWNYSTNGNNRFGVSLDSSNRLCFSAYDGVAYYGPNRGAQLNIGQIYTVICTFDNGAATIYVDGAASDSGVSSVLGGLIAGSHTLFATGGNFIGDIYRTVILDRVLTAGEVANLHTDLIS